MTLYDVLLRLYPRRVRDRFATGMRAAFAEDYARARERGRLAAGSFLVATAFHTIGAAICERLPRVTTVRSFFATDLRDAVRSLGATRITTVVAVLSLGLGIGANTALFSILYSLTLKPLPVAEPDRLVVVDGTWSYPIWAEVRDRHAGVVDGALAWSHQRFNLAPSGPLDLAWGAYVSGGFFQTLGVGAAVGRTLEPADDVRGGGPDGHVAVVSHRLWRQRYNGALDVLGRVLTIRGVPFTIVGVAEPGFLGPVVGQALDVFVPLSSEAAVHGSDPNTDSPTRSWIVMMLRLEAGQSLQAAAAALNAARPAIRDATLPLAHDGHDRADHLSEDFRLIPGATGVSSLRDRFSRPVTIIMALVAMVLLIACANIAHVMLARAAARRHELSVRLALGASHARLGCQLFVESLLLAVAGGAAGLGLAYICAPLLVSQLGGSPGAVTLDLALDKTVLGFTALVAMSATVLFGSAPAIAIRRVDPGDALKEQSRTFTGSRRVGLRGTLVVVQVALSFLLVVGAALFVRTFTTLVTTPLGFDPEGLLIVTAVTQQIDVPPADEVALHQRVVEAVAGSAGVVHASSSFLTPMGGRPPWRERIEVEGSTLPASTPPVTFANSVGPDWFKTYGMRVLAGRGFSTGDVVGSEAVAVVNEAFVRARMTGTNPVGLRIRSARPNQPERVIVGVVNDAIYGTVRDGIVPTVYYPMAQIGEYGSTGTITARLSGDRHSAERSIAEAIRQVDPQLGIGFRDYSDLVRATVVQERLVAILSGFFGGLAVLLAALGLYGVTAYSVVQRRPELAVRLALGASRGGIVRLVLGRVGLLLAAGTCIGLAFVLWAGRFIEAMLFNIGPRDPLTLAAAAALLCAVGVIAGGVPTMTASRLEPLTFLRD